MYTPTRAIVIFCVFIALAEAIYDVSSSSTSSSKHRRHSNNKSDNPANWADDNGIWSSILEEWAVRPTGVRDSRVLRPLSAAQVYVTNRIGEEDAMNGQNKQFSDIHPNGNQIVNHNGVIYQTEGPAQNGGFIPNSGFQFANPGYQHASNGNYGPQRREVSETDLYLLSAIEKLVYRVDFMEKRMRRMEQMLYYVINGSNKVSDPCPKNFTRAGENCYHFGVKTTLNWKSASATCRKMKSVLVEMENEKESKELIAFIQTNEELKEKDFWTGGLNPGLLWIWANSAKPVATEHSAANATNNAADIKGSGRCLKLSYKPTVRSYDYFGEDCSSRQHFVCEMQDNTVSNEISRMAKAILH